MSLKKIYVSGIEGTGKGTLLQLLDSHPDIFTCQIQGFGTSFYSNDFNYLMTQDQQLPNHLLMANGGCKISYSINNKIYNILIGSLFKFLFARDALKNLMDKALSKKMVGAASQEIQQYIDFDFDFYNFLKTAQQGATDERIFSTPEQLQDLLFESFIKNWKNSLIPYKTTSYVSCINFNSLDEIEKISTLTKDNYFLVLTRDPVYLAYTFAKRESLKSQIKRNFNRDLFSKKLRKKITAALEKAQKLANQNKNIHLVNFENLFFDTKNEMEKIADFLQIPFHENLTRATLNGIALEHEGKNFISTMNDDPYKILDSNTIQTLEFIYKGSPASFRVKIKALYWELYELLARIKKIITFS